MSTASPEPRIVAETGGLVIAEDGPLVLVIDRGTSPRAIAAFVLGVVALVLGGFGAVVLVAAAGDPGPAPLPPALGAGFLGAGVLAAAATIAIVRGIRRSRSRSLRTYRPVAIVDRARRVFTDADGTVVAQSDQVRFERRMQMTSSSPQLVAVTPNGTRVLKRGNPFDGGIGNLDQVLTAAVYGGTG